MGKPRYKTVQWSGRDLFACNHCSFDTLDRGLIVRHVMDMHGTPAEIAARSPLDGIVFASEEAAALAAEEELTSSDLAFTPSGQGGFTVADVRSAAKAVTTEEE